MQINRPPFTTIQYSWWPYPIQKLNKNPTNQLKSKTNKLITANNAELNSTKLPKIIGDYKPGYLYGKIPTPIYEFTKTIKQLISPYLPGKYNMKSTDELI